MSPVWPEAPCDRLIVPQQRLIATATDKQRVMEALPPPGVNALLDRFLLGEEGVGVTNNRFRQDIHAAAKNVPLAGWMVVSQMLASEAYAPIREMQRRMVLASLVLTLLAGCLVWFLLRRQLSPLFSAAQELVAIALVDRVGRKPLLAVGSAGMALTLAVMAWCFTRSSGGGESLQLAAPWGTVALVAANLYVIFFGVSWGPVTWVLLGEMFPNRIRAIALAVAAAAQWLANFAITASFPGLAEIGLPFAYGLYALFALLSLWFVVARVRETRGMELEAMSD